MELEMPQTDPGGGDEPFPNEPTVDDPGLEMPGEDPGSVEAPSDPDTSEIPLEHAATTPISR